MRRIGDHRYDDTGLFHHRSGQRLGEWRELRQLGVAALYLHPRWVYHAGFTFAGAEPFWVSIPSDLLGRPQLAALVELLGEAVRRAPASLDITRRARLVLAWGQPSAFELARLRATGVNDFDVRRLLDAASWRLVQLHYWRAARLARAAVRHAPSELEPRKALLLIEAERGAGSARVRALCDSVLALAPADAEALQIAAEVKAWKSRPRSRKIVGALPAAVAIVVIVGVAGLSAWSHWQKTQRQERLREQVKALTQLQRQPLTEAEARAARGHPEAMLEVANAHAYGRYGLKADLAAAYVWRMRAAEAGSAPAMRAVGEALLRGRGVAKDVSAALAWLEKAADGRSGSAADTLGDLFYAGSEVPQDYAAAYRWYLRAVELGYKGARGRLAYLRERGWGTPQDFASAFALYRVLADEGDAWAANKVGYLLATGQGVERDVVEAARWYRKGAEKGNVTAQMNLAYALRRGRGVARDPAEAARWLEKAAAQGNDGAAVILSEMLWRGEDMMPDRAEAVARLERLVEKGFAPARTMLAKLLVATGSQQDQPRARALFAAGAAAGSSADQAFHGLLCLEGVGGPRDIATALADLELAANAGQASAALFLAGVRMGYRQPGVLPDRVAAKRAIQLIKNPDKESAPYLRRLEEGGDLAALFAGKRMADTAMMPDDATSTEETLPWERLPEPTHQTPPIYPLAMRVLGMEGEVLVDFDITPAGRVEKVRALRSSHSAFDDAAVSAVQQWRFKPHVKAGRVRSVHMQVPIIFALNAEPGSMRVEVEVERPASAKP